VNTLVLRLKVAESLLETYQCTLRTQQFVSGDYEMWITYEMCYDVKRGSGLRDVKRADFIRRSGLKNLDKPKIFITKKVRNHSYQQFYPVLAKIRIN